MVDFGKESIDVDDEDAVDRIIQCSQAASPFFSVIINSQSQLKIDWLLTAYCPILGSSRQTPYYYYLCLCSNKLEVPNMLTICVVVSFLCGKELQVQNRLRY